MKLSGSGVGHLGYNLSLFWLGSDSSKVVVCCKKTPQNIHSCHGTDAMLQESIGYYPPKCRSVTCQLCNDAHLWGLIHAGCGVYIY